MEGIRDPDIALDAGVYIAIFTLLAGKKARMVIAVEPNSENFSYLERNVALNNAKNVKFINKALSDYIGKGFIGGWI